MRTDCYLPHLSQPHPFNSFPKAVDGSSNATEQIMTELYTTLKQAIENGRLIAIATIIAGPGIGNKMVVWPEDVPQGDLGAPELNEQVVARARTLMGEQRSARFTLETAAGPTEIFVDVQVPPRKMIIVGAVHIAIPLLTFAKTLGYYTIVVDARSAFATEDRFPHVDRLITQWPADALGELGIDESTCIVVLTHDEKLDNPALEVAVRSPARYIGALGSKKTHARRVNALKEMGATDEQIARIHAPIGIDIGARGPEEIAVSIIAQIVATQHRPSA